MQKARRRISIPRIAFCGAAAILLLLILSWIISYWYRHGVALTLGRQYEFAGSYGTLQLLVKTRTEAIHQPSAPPAVQEVDVHASGIPRLTFYWNRGIWLTTPHEGHAKVSLSSLRLYSNAMVRIGSDIPIATGSGQITYYFAGDSVNIHAVPYYPIVLPLALVMAIVYWCNRPMRERWRREGRCLQCGYDLRASPDRCPECGEPTATGAEAAS